MLFRSYIKKALVKDKATPADLISYQEARPLFPYDSTGDQFYDVEQFEAYRALGASVTRRAIAPESQAPSDDA